VPPGDHRLQAEHRGQQGQRDARVLREQLLHHDRGFEQALVVAARRGRDAGAQEALGDEPLVGRPGREEPVLGRRQALRGGFDVAEHLGGEGPGLGAQILPSGRIGGHRASMDRIFKRHFL
jgi:hypothetical protein